MPSQKNPIEDAATASSDAPISAALIAKSFAMNFYIILNTEPESLHKFYKEDSCFTVSDENESASATEEIMGDKAIGEKLSSLDLLNSSGTVAKLFSLDAQNSFDGSVLIRASGVMKREGSPDRRFAQTVLLAPQKPSGFYIRNDMLCFLKDIGAPAEAESATPSPGSTSSLGDASSTPTAAASSAPSEVAAVSGGAHLDDPSTATRDSPVHDATPSSPHSSSNDNDGVDADASVADATAATSSHGKDDAGQAHHAKGAEVAEPAAEENVHANSTAAATTTAAAATTTTTTAAAAAVGGGKAGSASTPSPSSASSAPRSWSAIASRPGAAAATSTTPASSTTGGARGASSKPSSSSSKKRPGASRKPASPKGGGASNSSGGGKKAASSSVPVAIYVSNVPRGCRQDALGSAFKAYGEVRRVDIVTNEKSDRSFAFVEFSSPAAVKASIGAASSAGIFVDGQRLKVQEKKAKTSRSGGSRGPGSSGGGHNGRRAPVPAGEGRSRRSRPRRGQGGF